MVGFLVNDISCGHCANAITQAIQRLDPQARVDVNIAAKRVSVASSRLNEDEVESAIRTAGYTPQRQASMAPATPARGCCGCGGH